MLKLGEFFFKLRNYTTVPFVIYILIFVKDTMDFNYIIAGTCSMILGELIRIYGVAYIGGVSRTRTASVGQKLNEVRSAIADAIDNRSADLVSVRDAAALGQTVLTPGDERTGSNSISDMRQ